jgi:hypothetical protein
MGWRAMRRMGSTTKLALAVELLLELVNYFVVGYPAGAHLAVREGWFGATAAQWYLLHMPGIFALNESRFLRADGSLGSIVLFLSGWLDTALLLAACIWPVQLILRVFRRSPGPLKTEN